MKKFLSLAAVLLVVFAVVGVRVSERLKEESIAKQAAENFEPLVKITSADKVVEQGDYETFVADNSEFSVKVAFVSERYLENVTINAVTFTDNGDGKVTFNEEPLYITDLDKPLIAQMVFYGEVVPNMGLSYTDVLGDKHSFFITRSGKDGSLRLENFDAYLTDGLQYQLY